MIIKKHRGFWTLLNWEEAWHFTTLKVVHDQQRKVLHVYTLYLLIESERPDGSLQSRLWMGINYCSLVIKTSDHPVRFRWVFIVPHIGQSTKFVLFGFVNTSDANPFPISWDQKPGNWHAMGGLTAVLGAHTSWGRLEQGAAKLCEVNGEQLRIAGVLVESGCNQSNHHLVDYLITLW